LVQLAERLRRLTGEQLAELQRALGNESAD
jgi:hypothetical protein